MMGGLFFQGMGWVCNSIFFPLKVDLEYNGVKFERQAGNKGSVLKTPQNTFVHVMLVIVREVTDDSLCVLRGCSCDPERLACFPTYSRYTE